MYPRYIVYILFLFNCNADALPSAEFIREFAANHHQRSSVILHVPDQVSTYNCLKW